MLFNSPFEGHAHHKVHVYMYMYMSQCVVEQGEVTCTVVELCVYRSCYVVFGSFPGWVGGNKDPLTLPVTR